MFPSMMTDESIKRAVREAYGNSARVRVLDGGEWVRLRGTEAGLTIDLLADKETIDR